jgi:hypothetical protein
LRAVEMKANFNDVLAVGMQVPCRISFSFSSSFRFGICLSAAVDVRVSQHLEIAA